ncbi:MAG: glycoside hydrolase family 16 protein [Pseudomonadota bacterium]|nr:glycoside hydrolase family 16 protein [Pseudomonadota bacterium]
MRRRHAALAAVLAWVCLTGCASTSRADPAIFFDDFSEPDLAALGDAGWTVRAAPGHPGIPGAAWGAASVSLVDDPARSGNRLLRLRARTDGTAAGTSQAQVCHARKYLEGTYAARVRFSDAPVSGPNGDVVVQTFYAVAPLRFDLDPLYSELDWEYLPNGGWGDPRTRLYGVSWQTVRLEPWWALNQAHEAVRPMGGWHVLLMQVAGGRTTLFIDGEQQAVHGGRNYPVVPMAISFSQWFSPGGDIPGVHATRTWEEDVDWVFHVRDVVLSSADVESRVERFRTEGVARWDSVTVAEPALASPCDF